MPTPSAPPPKLVEELRLVLRDSPNFNRLLDNVENKELTDKDLALALNRALSDYNSTPPFTNEAFGRVPFGILLSGGLLYAAETLGFGHTRNEFNYSSGGITARTSDKTPHYLNWLNSVGARYEKAKIEYKVAKNVMSGLGASVPSEYANVAWFVT